MSLKLTNTLTGRAEEFRPFSGTVGIYTCGMTVQDRPHVGHMRAYVTSDILRRYLEFSGYKVMALQNVTDIDDKIIARSQEEKTDYRVIAERYHQEYLDVADRMNILRPSVFPRATQHVQEMIELIERLIEKGAAYESGGDVYFEVARFPEYGKLSKKKVEDLIVGHRVAPGEFKRSPADFALWKAAKPGEPYWHSPWGKGRPGWHIECSAMAMHYLGDTFDIHMGGEDTIFPHHENEIAQSEAATGKPFARFWIHNAHLNLTGEKFSKSNMDMRVFAARDLLDGIEVDGKLREYSANVVRLYFLKAHYRSPIEFSFELLDEAKKVWSEITDFIDHTGAKGAQPDYSPLKETLDDDLNTPGAVGLVFDAVRSGDVTKARKFLEVLGFKPPKGFVEMAGRARLGYRPGGSVDASTSSQQLLKQRDDARVKKDFAEADRLRAQINSLGYLVEDASDHSRLVRPSVESEHCVVCGKTKADGVIMYVVRTKRIPLLVCGDTVKDGTCPVCRGGGRITVMKQGQKRSESRPCDECLGTGKIDYGARQIVRVDPTISDESTDRLSE